MAIPVLIASAVIAGVGTAVSAVAQSNALRSQAKARKVAGEQELAQQKSLLRRELGESAVAASASGLLGGSFEQVFTSQAIEDANFLGQIKQRTDFDVASLKQQARLTLATGLTGAAAQTAGGVAGAKAAGARAQSAEAQRRQLLKASPGSRLVPGGNIFSGTPTRNRRTATFF